MARLKVLDVLALLNWNLLFLRRYAGIVPLLRGFARPKLHLQLRTQSDSVPPWTRTRNRDRSSSISQTLFPPPLSSATRITGLAIIVSLPERTPAPSVATLLRIARVSGALRPASASSTVPALPAVLPSSPASRSEEHTSELQS